MAVVNRRWRRECLSFVCYTLPFAFFPVWCLYISRIFHGATIKLSDVMADSGVLAIAIALSADGLSRLMASDSKWRDIKIVAAALAAWDLACGSFFYALRYVGRAVNSTVLVDLSLLVLIVSTMVAMFCRFLPEDDR